LRRREHIPFGPFLALGATVALFWGERAVAWYLGFLR
jgi:leader peptidase (prepilin peptidase) / N-methyltransferase